jgi:hypothetical protein
MPHQAGDTIRGPDGRVYTFRGGDDKIKDNWTTDGDITSFPDPPGSINPYKRLSAKGGEALYSKQTTAFDKAQTTASANADQARFRQSQLNRFKELNTTQKTGGALGFPLIGQVLQMVQAPFDPELREMRALTSQIAPSMRAPGSGSSSDKDVEMFKEGTVGVDKPKETNDNLVTAANMMQQNNLDRPSFNDAYFQKFGTLNGMEQSWQKYLNENPIFDHSAKAKYVLNKKRIGWDKFIEGLGGQKGPQKVGRFVVEAE